MSYDNTFGPWPGNGEGSTPPGGEPTTPATIVETDGGIPFWNDAPDIWDTITIAGFTFPGVANVGGEPKRKLDKKNAKGADNRTITDDGMDGTDVEIIIRIWTREQWVNYQLALPLIDPNQQKGKLQPVDIVHPSLKLHKVKSMYIESITLPTTTSIPQLREVRIKATSWAPAPKVPKTSKSSTPDTSNSGDESGTLRKSLGTTGVSNEEMEALLLEEAGNANTDEDIASWWDDNDKYIDSDP